MIASNGVVEEGSGVVEEMEREGRSVVEEPRRSPAVRDEVPVVVDWIWEAEYSLGAWLVCYLFRDVAELCCCSRAWCSKRDKARKQNSLRDSDWELPGSRDGLHHNI
jgi:hypothetical protein